MLDIVDVHGGGVDEWAVVELKGRGLCRNGELIDRPTEHMCRRRKEERVGVGANCRRWMPYRDGFSEYLCPDC